ncbi:hypothetical protein N1027_01265 [Herbiconiux sp. CPCC 205763]|uniref:O-antigen ligase domain-containing protein n=1 Tax=Herbiconiux aconitum TaxID=2970913 RepID=A0ABT2GKK5_9MICO|nr:hypothetical protein [Herbiconiux aconitum]MCS5716759.1 hypothetical protein [Herbiconiux aconitum]
MVSSQRYRSSGGAGLSAGTILLSVTSLGLVGFFIWLAAGDKDVAWVIFMGLVAITSFAFVLMDKPIHLAVLLFTASLLQRALGAIFENPNALLLDDLVLVSVALWVVSQFLRRRNISSRTVVFILVFFLIMAVAFVQATNTSIAIYQLRQILVPVILVLFGMCLTKEQVQKLTPFVIFLGVIGALYAAFELLGVYPVDPAGYSGFQSTGPTLSYGRDLPGFYYYYLPDGEALIRTGGLLLNPPSFGMYCGAAFMWVWLDPGRRSMAANLSLSAILLFGAISSFSRGGFVILALAILQPFLTRKSGQLAFILVAAVIGFVALQEFSDDGQSGRHVDGAFYGFQYALTHPIGGGFGRVGNAVASLTGESTDAGESLAAIFLAAAGWFGILVIAYLIYRGVRAGRTMNGAALTAAVLVALLSETAGGLDATGTLWILAGTALGYGSRAQLPVGGADIDEPDSRSSTPIITTTRRR